MRRISLIELYRKTSQNTDILLFSALTKPKFAFREIRPTTFHHYQLNKKDCDPFLVAEAIFYVTNT